MKKRILCLCFVILLLFSVFPFSVFAETVTIYNSDVMEDIKAMGIDPAEYSKDEDGKAKLLFFLEYGYDQRGEFSNYALIIYLYNPTGEQISDSDLNTLQFNAGATRNDVVYAKNSIKLLGVSDEAGYENVFVKFRVQNVLPIARAVKASCRQYKLVSIEYYTKGGKECNNLTLGYDFKYTGFQPYHDLNRSESNTLYFEYAGMDVIQVDLHQATWFSSPIESSGNARMELFSVYFAIPNKYLRKYGNLEDSTSGLRTVRGEYERRVINGIISNNNDVLTLFDGIKGADIRYTNSDTYNSEKNYNSAWNFGFYELESEVVMYVPTPFPGVPYYYDLCDYNINFNVCSGADGDRISAYLGLVDHHITGNPVYKICSTLYSNNDYMSAEDFKSAYISESSHYLESSGKQTYEINTSDTALTESIQTYAGQMSKENWLKQWASKIFTYNWSDDDKSYSAIPAIEQVDKNFICGDASYVWSETEGADKLFMNVESYREFREFVNDNFFKDNTIFVMRFALDEYYSASVKVSDNKGHVGANDLGYGDMTSYFERSYYIGFDIFEFEFEDKEGRRVVVPVSTKPIDISGGIIGGTIKPGDENKTQEPSWWEKLLELFNMLNAPLKVIILTVAFVFLLFVIWAIWKGVGWIITGIGRGIGSVFGFAERKIDKHYERAEHKEDIAYKSEERQRQRDRHGMEKESHFWKRNDQIMKEEEFLWKAEDRKRLRKQRKEADKIKKDRDKK